jgi:hypothetical protein
MRNFYFSDRVKSEQNLYEDIVIESLKMYGQDVYYLPRDTIGEDRILGDEVPARYNSSHKIEMYIENTEGFDGEGDLFTRFGVEIRDECTFVVSKRRWLQQVQRMDSEVTALRPFEGDMVYMPMSGSLFQITHVEHEQPFYQLNNLPVFKLRAQLAEYNDEDLDTGIERIDNIETSMAFTYILSMAASEASNTFNVGDTIQQQLATATITGEVSLWQSSTLQLHIVHTSSSDGNYHEWVPGTIIRTSVEPNTTHTVTSVNELIKQTRNAQNDEFESFADGFLDFSEDNPFGDPNDG